METITGTVSDFSPEFESAIAQYRHKIFIERLGWQLPVENGMERDQFDRPDTLYVIARNGNGAICGCARLLPTTRPYLLGDIFPNLLVGMPVPCDNQTWELSRFAVADIDAESVSQSEATRNTRALLAASIKSAAEHGACRLITVSPLGIERLLQRMGVHAHRAGPPVLVDGKPVFACWIEIDQQTMSALDIDTNAPAPIAH
ncbi:MAG TPA: acyl-homoserine-lactone synthase [Paucimonas sp.]|nr:acyl-homoserine-lactone synthase [Paucimonas sp.]